MIKDEWLLINVWDCFVLKDRPPKKLRNRIRHNIMCKCFNKKMLSQHYYRNLSFFRMHPENQVRCSQWHFLWIWSFRGNDRIRDLFNSMARFFAYKDSDEYPISSKEFRMMKWYSSIHFLRLQWARFARNEWQSFGGMYYLFLAQISFIVFSWSKPVGAASEGVLAQYQLLFETGSAKVLLPGICR